MPIPLNIFAKLLSDASDSDKMLNRELGITEDGNLAYKDKNGVYHLLDPHLNPTLFYQLLSQKVDIHETKDLSTNDFTDEYKQLLDDFEQILTDLGDTEVIEITPDQTIEPEGTEAPAGNVRMILNWIVNRIKLIIGKNWWETPSANLEDLKTHIDAESPHSNHETLEGSASKYDSLIATLNNHMMNDPHGGVSSWDEIQNKPLEFPPETHGHNLANSMIDGFISSEDKNKLDLLDPNAQGTSEWEEIQNKPLEFPPETHGHNLVDTTNPGFMSSEDKTKLDLLDPNAQGGVSSWEEIENKPLQFPPEAHIHSAEEVGLGNLRNVEQLGKNETAEDSNKLGGKTLDNVKDEARADSSKPLLLEVRNDDPIDPEDGRIWIVVQ